jgi:protein-L-isoaspartate(D-aspartate) O-methyltransferase
VPVEYVEEAYGDYPLPIGFGQTISQPTTVALMLELLQPHKGDKILDVGSGSGWTTALLARIAESGPVYGVEIVPELVAFGAKNLGKYGFRNASIAQAGKELGLPREAPFDRILVSASSSDLPESLVKQLKVGGTMVIPIGDSVFRIVKKTEKDIEEEEFPGFLFVPLIMP